ncbi:BPI fold-containing family C protein [Lamellibrachia satsuma]|nr:BPI fold-containing family C protein [Lamellibrachia satsuma]
MRPPATATTNASGLPIRRYGVTVCRVTKRKHPVATRKFVEAGAAPTLEVLYSSFSKSDNISHGEDLVVCSHRTRLYTMTSMFVFLAWATLGLSEASDLPGLKIRLSAKALDYVSSAALDVMSTKLTGKSIDDHHGQSGKTKYDITGTRITSFEKPVTGMTVAPGSGITWKLSGGSVSMHGDWHYKYRRNRFIKLSDSGSFDASVSGLELRISIMLGMDNSGQPTVHTTRCSSEVGSANVHLHGGGSWFYNIFNSAIERNVKSKLKDRLCEAARESIDKEGVKRMQSLNLQVIFAKLLMLDYRLVATPKFTNSYVESMHKGEVFQKGDMTEAPFQPLPLPDGASDGSHMMTLWASDYVLNTLGHLLQRYGLVQYRLSNKDLETHGKPHLLDTTCPGDVCIGKFVDGVSKQFPNSSVLVHMVSIGGDDFPRFTMLPGELRGHLSGQVYFSAQTPNGSHVHLFKTRVNLTTSMSVKVDCDRVKAKVVSFNINMEIVHANFKAVIEPELESFFKVIADIWIIPKLNELGDIGLELPSVKDLGFVNHEIKILKGALQLGVDFKYL